MSNWTEKHEINIFICPASLKAPHAFASVFLLFFLNISCNCVCLINSGRFYSKSTFFPLPIWNPFFLSITFLSLLLLTSLSSCLILLLSKPFFFPSGFVALLESKIYAIHLKKYSHCEFFAIIRIIFCLFLLSKKKKTVGTF